MNQRVEIKYRKFFIDAGQHLRDLPAYHRMQRNGWQVTWSYQNKDTEGIYIETLMQRSIGEGIQAEQNSLA